MSTPPVVAHDTAATDVSAAAVVPASAPPTPSDIATALVPPAGWRERVAWYAGAMLLSLVLATVGMQLWDRDLRAPFYYDNDGLLYLPVVKATIELGSHSRNDRLGAPGVQEMYDFPIIDHLHFAALWLLGRVFPDLSLVYNVYGLLNYPLTVLTAMWVMRWLGLSLPAAAVGALLYAFLPYHQERYQYHYFLAAYWWVPVSLVPALAICKGEFPFFRRGPNGLYPPAVIHWRSVWAVGSGAVRGSGAAWKSVLAWATTAGRSVLRELLTWRTLVQCALGAVTASAGAYYAFFACAGYGFAGLYGWVVFKTWRAAVAAMLVIAPVVAVGVLFHMPSYLYHSQYGRNPIADRFPEEADLYGLKIAHLLLPANDHNFRPFANLRAKYSTSPIRPSENEAAGSLGVVGGAGLVALFGLAILPARRRWPEGAVAALTLYFVLLSSMGAFGSLFNFLVIPEIRAYNRVCVFIGFLCLFVVMWWLDRFLLSRTGCRMRQARYPVLAIVLIAGYFDQTPWGWNPFNPRVMESTDLFAERFRADKRFFKKIEEVMPAGTQIFCLPYEPFPEYPPLHKMGTYEHMRGYVLTNTLRWSAGAIKGREADAWQKDVVYSKPDEMLRRIVVRGFDGLTIDGRGYPPSKDVDKAAALVNRINELYRGVAGPSAGRLPEIVHEDGKQFFIDLRPYRDALQRMNPADYADQVKKEREWLVPLWLGGFSPEAIEDGERLYWGPFDAQLVLVNPSDQTRKVVMTFAIGPEVVGPFDITIGAPFNDAFVIDKTSDLDAAKRDEVEKRYELDLPPGRTTIPFRCRPPEYFLPFDKKNRCYYIKNFKLREVVGH